MQPGTPPHIETPGRLYMVRELGDIFEEAVDRISNSGVVGLRMEGAMLAREDVLCWVNICNTRNVFMFDIITGEQAFKFGLRSVLQDSELLKVVHDCRQVNNCLNQQWSVTLSNVWNTMAGDIVFSNNGFVPQYARSLAKLLKGYLAGYS